MKNSESKESEAKTKQKQSSKKNQEETISNSVQLNTPKLQNVALIKKSTSKKVEPRANVSENDVIKEKSVQRQIKSSSKKEKTLLDEKSSLENSKTVKSSGKPAKLATVVDLNSAIPAECHIAH